MCIFQYNHNIYVIIIIITVFNTDCSRYSLGSGYSSFGFWSQSVGLPRCSDERYTQKSSNGGDGGWYEIYRSYSLPQDNTILMFHSAWHIIMSLRFAGLTVAWSMTDTGSTPLIMYRLVFPPFFTAYIQFSRFFSTISTMT